MASIIFQLSCVKHIKEYVTKLSYMVTFKYVQTRRHSSDDKTHTSHAGIYSFLQIKDVLAEVVNGRMERTEWKVKRNYILNVLGKKEEKNEKNKVCIFHPSFQIEMIKGEK
ncbi:hypothetical protein J1N35_045034 [Gossypium stocksii]|uniref:Uncharacterized protein n=1 Tax=Gossypium stocksii TaxID=47602 RepID=A0A9D3UAN2_9ROSI|nr:hypothetical protein J1N35_045034 [Gossypium stocksii]